MSTAAADASAQLAVHASVAAPATILPVATPARQSISVPSLQLMHRDVLQRPLWCACACCVALAPRCAEGEVVGAPERAALAPIQLEMAARRCGLMEPRRLRLAMLPMPRGAVLCIARRASQGQVPL